MKTEARVARRLLSALEDFVSRENVLLGCGEFREAVAIQRRASPLIARLCQIGERGDDMKKEFRDRISVILAKRRQSVSLLVERKTFLRSEQERVSAMRTRLQRISPYGDAVRTSKSARFSAAV